MASIVELPLGTRVEDRREDFQAAIDRIYEGYQRHYGSDTTDLDLSLLEGDHLYAQGLVALAELQDLEAVAVLGDAISLLALANVRENAVLTDSLWQMTAAAVAHGRGSEFDSVKNALLENETSAAVSILKNSEKR